MNPSAAAERVRKIAKLLRADAERIVALQRLVDLGNTDAVAVALGPFAEGAAASLLNGAAIEAMVLACSRAWDADGPGRYTVPAAAARLSNPETLSILSKRGDREALGHFVRLTDEMATNHARERIRDFRNYKVAHSLPDEYAQVAPATLQHLQEMIDETLRVVYHLGHGAGVISVSFDAVTSVWNERCEAYWHRLTQGPQGRQVARGAP